MKVVNFVTSFLRRKNIAITKGKTRKAVSMAISFKERFKQKSELIGKSGIPENQPVAVAARLNAEKPRYEGPPAPFAPSAAVSVPPLMPVQKHHQLPVKPDVIPPTHSGVQKVETAPLNYWEPQSQPQTLSVSSAQAGPTQSAAFGGGGGMIRSLGFIPTGILPTSHSEPPPPPPPGPSSSNPNTNAQQSGARGNRSSQSEGEHAAPAKHQPRKSQQPQQQPPSQSAPVPVEAQPAPSPSQTSKEAAKMKQQQQQQKVSKYARGSEEEIPVTSRTPNGYEAQRQQPAAQQAKESRPRTDPPPAHHRRHNKKEDNGGGRAGGRVADELKLPPITRKPITYEPYTLEDYRSKREEWAKQKAGGLGPSDTDDQRAAAAKLQRLREYAENVKKINRLLAPQHSSDSGDDVSPSPMRVGAAQQPQRFVGPSQPTPTEVVEKLQRRERALEYAKLVPKPKLRITSEAAVAGDAVVSRPPPDDELCGIGSAEAARESLLSDLEAKHEQDQRMVEGIRKQLRI